MKKKFFFMYGIVMICAIFLVLYIAVYDLHHNARKYPSDSSMTTWTDYQVTCHEDGTATVTGTITVDPSVGNILAFYSVHQNVSVAVDEKIIYRYPLENHNLFSETPGYSWNFISLPESENHITIDISSPYSEYDDRIYAFYMGNIASISSFILNDSLPAFIVCIIIFGLGVCMTGYWLVIRHKIKLKKSLLYLGVFAILLSIWSINETNIMVLLLQNNIACVYISLISIMLLPLPFALFVKTFYEEESTAWNLFCYIDMIQISLCLIFQVLGIADLRSTLWTTHVMFGFLAVIVLHSSLKHLKQGIHSKRVMVHIICIFICAVALASDMIDFYQNCWDSNNVGRISFLLYFVVLGITSTKESASLMKLGKKANLYQQLAYTDQMTQLKNRTAFNQDFENYSQSPYDMAVLDFDLNCLKQINDTKGHSLGDQYIMNASQIIQEVFGTIGTCYRVGGDEFVVLLETASELDIPYYLNLLEWKVDTYNRDHDNFHMDIAHGYAVYDITLDKNLEDTYNRADKEMYINKNQKKTAMKE